MPSTEEEFFRFGWFVPTSDLSLVGRGSGYGFWGTLNANETLQLRYSEGLLELCLNGCKLINVLDNADERLSLRDPFDPNACYRPCILLRSNNPVDVRVGRKRPASDEGLAGRLWAERAFT